VVVVAALAVVLVLALGGSSSKSGPSAAVDKLLKADVNHDVQAAQAVTCEPLKSHVPDILKDPDKSYKLGKTTQNGNSAKVAATVTDSENESGTVIFDVQKQSDAWKVCDYDTSGSGGGSGGGGGQATGVPTDLPSDLPSGFPTDFPSGIPSIGPSDFPTDGGAGSSICFTPNGQSPICVP